MTPPASGAVISRAVAQALETEAAQALALTQFSVDALVAGAVRPRPQALAFVDHYEGAANGLRHADLYQRVGAFLARLRQVDLAPGDGAVICAPPCAQSFVALTACLAAGLSPVLAPLPLPATQHALESAARDLKVSALFAPAAFAGVDFEETLQALAARTPTLRFIGALHGALDGAADFTADMLAAAPAARPRLAEEWRDETLLPRLGALDSVGRVDFIAQGALLGAALDLVRMTRESRRAPMLALQAPSSLASLVAGPLAALMSGAPLHYLSPVGAVALLETLDALRPAHLVAPSTLLPDLARAGVLGDGTVCAVTAIAPEGAAPLRLEAAVLCPVVEIGAAGPGAAPLALRRVA